MKKLIVFAMIGYAGFFGFQKAQKHFEGARCGINNLKISNTELNLKDKFTVRLLKNDRLKSKNKRLVRHLMKAKTAVVYRTSKNEPALTIFTANYLTNKTAKAAQRHFKRKYKSNKKKQYEVIRNGKTVSLVSNRSLSAQCFTKIVDSKLNRKQEKKLVASGRN